MHYTAPGHQHIQLLAPSGARALHEPVARPQRTPKPRGVEPVVHQAIDAALGGRDPASPLASIFVPAVRAHIRARKREREGSATQQVRILSCHANDNGEYFGAVQAGERRYAYAARVEGGKLVSFKVL